MDDDRFDALARVLGSGGTRRGLFRGAAGSALAWLGLNRSPSRSFGQESTDDATSLTLPVCTCPHDLVLCAGLCVAPADCLAPESFPALAPSGCTDVSGGQGLDCFEVGFQAGADAARKAVATKGVSGSIQDAPDNVAEGGTPVPAAEDAALRAVSTKGVSGSATGQEGAAPSGAAACPPQTQLCEAKGTCVSCPTVMLLDGNCRCVCPDPFLSEASVSCQCPKIAHCDCVCPGAPCEYPKIQNPRDCRCICVRSCPAGQEQDPVTCKCICPRGQQLCDITGECLPCPSGRALDPRTCRCVCEHATCGAECCPAGRVCDNTQSPPACCRPRTTCPSGFCGTVTDRCGGQLACPCEPGQTCCESDCVDTLTDAEHCGRCGHECPRGGECVDGVCPCEGGIICDGACLEGSECCTAADCPNLGPCQSAICGFPGGVGTPQTPRVCVYAVAPDGASCPNGMCCGGTCLIGTDCCSDEHCPPLYTCQDNVCTCVPVGACAVGSCGPVADNCGGQTMCPCPAGQTCCSGACVDTQTSSADCGACGQPCEPGQSCINGQCGTGCPPVTRRCKDKCVACPPEATLNPETCDCICETISVPTNGSTVRSNMVLLPGRKYTIRVSGRFTIGGGRFADADYVVDANDNLQTNRCGAYNGDIGLTVDDPNLSRPTKTPASWGPYTKSHVYTTTYTGTGNPISFTYNDCIYRDNSGTLTVEILCDCAGIDCGSPKVLDAGTCECVCPDTACDDECCGPGQVCNASVDPPQCCKPQNVCPEGSCGLVPDGCGGTIDHGPCPEQLCIYGVCNQTAQEVGQCNGCAYVIVADNRPGPLCDRPGQFCCGRNCCQAGQVCANGQCCTPGGACAADYCGPVDNGCGGQLLCECAAGSSCCGGRCVACPPDATLNPDTCDCVCETIVVPTNGTTVTSTMSLTKGRTYTIRVSGTFTITGGRLADADYVFTPNGVLTNDECGAYQQPSGVHRRGDIGLTIDDPTRKKAEKTPPSWGPYNTAHVYATVYTAPGGPLSFTYNDCVVSDNVGTLTVEILCDCPAVQCPAPKIQSQETCGCVCPAVPCSAPRIQFEDTCRCECPAHEPCPAGKVFDDKTCKCICPAHPPCPKGFTFDDKTCTCVCPNICPPRSPGTCDCVAETVQVGTNGTPFKSTMLLTKGTQYTIKVCGKFDIGGGRFADAEYVFAPNDDLQTNKCGAYSGDIGLTIDDPGLARPTKTPMTWGVYTKSHAYATTYTGTGNPISFTYNDCIYSDNSGILNVEILCPTSPGVSTGVAVATGVAEPDETPAPPTPTPTPLVTGSTGETGGTGGTGATGAVGPPPPTPTPTPTPTNTPGPAGPTATPTPAGPPDCSDDELLCANTCIPASECPAETCCLDTATCACTCPDCNANQVFDPDDCACICTLGECPANYVFDEVACTCTCQPPQCPPNWGFDETSCSCVCVPPECPTNWVADEASCSCVCVSFECPANFTFDGASCSCVCLPPPCPANYSFDEASCSCSCAPLACPANYLLDEASCSCFCPELGCPEGQVFDPGSCTCLPSGGTGESQGTA